MSGTIVWCRCGNPTPNHKRTPACEKIRAMADAPLCPECKLPTPHHSPECKNYPPTGKLPTVKPVILESDQCERFEQSGVDRSVRCPRRAKWNIHPDAHADGKVVRSCGFHANRRWREAHPDIVTAIRKSK